VIDLRSDTVTKPTEAMRAAMAEAPVGDDVYGEDPTVQALEQQVAMLLGHEAGLFCASGSLANVLGVRLLVEPGQEVVCDVTAHIARAEMGAHAALHGLTMRTFPSVRGRLDAAQVAAIVAPDAGPYLVSTAAVAMENTHNFGGGTIQPYDELVAVAELCRGSGMSYHLDGARLWNAHVATGIDLLDYGRLFDTVSVCFSKGLGAPVGSALAGPADLLARARRFRGIFGGAMRQAGIIAAGALHAIEHHRPRLAVDHARARGFAEAVAGLPGVVIDPARVASNIVIFGLERLTAVEVVDRCWERGVRMLPFGPDRIRAVFHLDAPEDGAERAAALLGEVLRLG
jgi:threonine aldolase